MHPLLNIGIRAARRAGDIIVRNINRLDSIKVSTKGRNDFVSEVARQAAAEHEDQRNSGRTSKAYPSRRPRRGVGVATIVLVASKKSMI